MSKRTGLRRLIPFPSRATLRQWFPSFETRNIAHLIEQSGADLLLDAGANVGQFALRMRAAKLSLPILSLEPLTVAHDKLSARAGKDPAWRVAPRAALAATPGQVLLRRYADETLSSVLEPLPRVARSPALALAGEEKVPAVTLDALLAAEAPEARRPFLKLDLQGSEFSALEGGRETLARAAGVLIELSLTPAYSGEPSYLTLLTALDSAGFTPVYCARVTTRRRFGPWLQMDCLLLRRKPA